MQCLVNLAYQFHSNKTLHLNNLFLHSFHFFGYAITQDLNVGDLSGSVYLPFSWNSIHWRR